MSEQTTAQAETVVVFWIRPPLDEQRWRAFHDAASALGAYRGHINPPDFPLLTRDRLERLAAEIRAASKLVMMANDGATSNLMLQWASQLDQLISSPETQG